MDIQISFVEGKSTTPWKQIYKNDEKTKKYTTHYIETKKWATKTYRKSDHEFPMIGK